MDINSHGFAKQLLDIIDQRVEEGIRRAIEGRGNAKLVFEVPAKVDIASPPKVFLNNSDTSVEVLNPRNLTLNPGTLVAVVFPNFKNDSTKYIDRVL